MPKSIPTIGQQNWGATLNNHLSQLQNPTNGGLNSGTTAQRPSAQTLGTDSEGYTYLDTTTKELLKWNGTGWDVLLRQGSGGGIGDPIPFDLTGAELTTITSQITGFAPRTIPYGFTFVIRNWKIFTSNNTSARISLKQPDGNYIAPLLYTGVAGSEYLQTFDNSFSPQNTYLVTALPAASDTIIAPVNITAQTYPYRSRDGLIFLTENSSISVYGNASFTQVSEVSGFLIKNQPGIEYVSLCLNKNSTTYVVPAGRVLYLTTIMIFRQLNTSDINVNDGSYDFSLLYGPTTGTIFASVPTANTILATATNSFVNDFGTVRQFPAAATIALGNASPNAYAIISGYLVNA